MALIKCPECGAEVSSLAEECPKCAYPLNVVTFGKSTISPKQLRFDLMEGYIFLAVGVLIVMLAKAENAIFYGEILILLSLFCIAFIYFLQWQSKKSGKGKK
jgi:hypothetical protein